MKKPQYPPGWDEARVQRVLTHYEGQSDEEAAAEDEAAFRQPGQTTMVVPSELVPVIGEMIARYEKARSAGADAVTSGEAQS